MLHIAAQKTSRGAAGVTLGTQIRSWLAKLGMHSFSIASCNRVRCGMRGATAGLATLSELPS